MKVGDIVRLKRGHHLQEFIQGNCIVDDHNHNSYYVKYHIKTLDGKNCMTWVYSWEVEMVSDLRQQTLEKLGI